MINNNKILTVSYGTFSCTLEGFDDSFGTMKAIAEYFRDLASDDRYFGAEPPQPDAEMLARIAQKEISRRVEAREHEGKIVLSAIEDSSGPDSTGDAPGSAAQAAAPVVAAAAALSSKDEAQAPVAEVVEAETPAAAEAKQAESVDPAQDAHAEDEAQPDLSVEIETADAQTVIADASHEDEAEEVAPADVAFEEDENDIVPGQPDAEVEAFFDSAEDSDASDEDMIAPANVSSEDVTDPNSIAAKLQRIRAVVAQQDDAAEDTDYSEDEHAESEMRAAADVAVTDTDEDADDAEAEEVMANARREIEDALDADEEFDASADEVSDAEVDDIAAMLARMNLDDDADAQAEVEEKAPAIEANADTVAQDDVDHGIDTLMAELTAQDEAEEAPESLFAPEDEADAILEAEVDHVAEEAEAAPSQQLRVSKELRLEPQPEEAAEDTIAQAAPVAPARPRARVIKVKRADLDAAIERGDLEEYDEEDDAAEAPLSLDDLAPAKSESSSLSAEEEDELARELAALEADIEMEQGHTDAAPAAEPKSEEKPAAVAQEAKSARAKLPSIDDAQSDDVDRLLAETDHQMGEPESATRRDAFAHLRAAVAAKKADEALGSQDKDASQDDAYRSDLADVVRPRRPASKATSERPARPTRPSENRSAPLKLVAEQRIDVDRPAPSGPVRPRRVSGIADSAPAIEDESFGEFASEMGATKLPDLLEAAAAYMAFVEGREQFSRPQLMTKVRQATPDGFSREDTLRSFGKLLREGKIEKIKGGRFVASEDIGFRPDQRAAS